MCQDEDLIYMPEDSPVQVVTDLRIVYIVGERLDHLRVSQEWPYSTELVFVGHFVIVI